MGQLMRDCSYQTWYVNLLNMLVTKFMDPFLLRTFLLGCHFSFCLSTYRAFRDHALLFQNMLTTGKHKV